MSRRMRLAELLPDVAGVPQDLEISGLVQDSRLDEATVLTVLGHLQQKAWALPLAGSDGRPRWFATAAGKAQTRTAMPA